ncbi:MAG: hypothetical protein KME46_33740 [Brasilonema angustatum HA4187-MV1]|nr:hypothetical protein [Brasilonema angustatum HA4187-MV1]
MISIRKNAAFAVSMLDRFSVSLDNVSVLRIKNAPASSKLARASGYSLVLIKPWGYPYIYLKKAKKFMRCQTSLIISLTCSYLTISGYQISILIADVSKGKYKSHTKLIKKLMTAPPALRNNLFYIFFCSKWRFILDLLINPGFEIVQTT